MQDLGKLILRLAVGGLMAFHGWAKIQDGIVGIGTILVAKGLPEELAYGVYVGEVLAPALLILGFFTRSAALLILVNMGVAIWLAHMDDLTTIVPHGGYKLELHAFYILGALAILCLGPGRLSVQGDTSHD